jgi:hypothetical protein
LGDHHAEDVGLVGLYVRQSRLVVDLINGLGGQAELLMLANGMGLRKNTHIAFADENNESVAELMEEWLMRVGLDVGLRNETWTTHFHEDYFIWTENGWYIYFMNLNELNS